MGVALQGTVSKLPESINMNNECLLTRLVLSVHFVPAPIVPACAGEQFNFAAGTRSKIFYRYEVGPKIFLKAPHAPKKLQTTKKTQNPLHSPSPQQLNVALKRDLIHTEKECNPLHQETLMALVAPLISLYPLHHP